MLTSVARSSAIRWRSAAASIQSVASPAGSGTSRIDTPGAGVRQVVRRHAQRGADHGLAVRGECDVVGPDRVDTEVAHGEQADGRGEPRRVVERRLPLDPGGKPVGCSHDTTSGSMRSRQAGATASTAVPRGAYAHLWKLPTQKSAPVPPTSTGSMPGAWAPSTATGMPRVPGGRHDASRPAGAARWPT